MATFPEYFSRDMMSDVVPRLSREHVTELISRSREARGSTINFNYSYYSRNNVRRRALG
jgi:hypothetical protein